VLDGPNEILNIGKSSYTEPILVSTLLTIHLSLFPEMRIKLWSNFSNELARQVGTGMLDLAVITGVPQKPQLSVLNIADNPFYIATERFAWSRCTGGTGCCLGSTRTPICTTPFTPSARTELLIRRTSITSPVPKKPLN
jgi:hypothetical protein